MSKAIVWACKEQPIRTQFGSAAMDYSPAEAYGELQFITKIDLPLHRQSTLRETWEDDVARFVAAYNPLTDFIIATGRPDAIFSIGYALGQVGKSPRFLVWRKEDNNYRILDSFQKMAPAVSHHSV